MELLDEVDLYFIPMANPDGYVYTQTDRMWRKTRSINPESACFGKKKLQCMQVICRQAGRIIYFICA